MHLPMRGPGAPRTGAGFPSFHVLLASLWVVVSVGALRGGAQIVEQEGAHELTEETRTLLTRDLQLSESDVDALIRGDVVRKTLDTDDSNEVVAVGAVRVGVPRAFLVEQVRDIVSFKRGKYVMEIGRFGTPPRPADLAGLSVSRDEVEAMRTCKPGDCDMKLTAGMLARLRQDVDWTAPDARARASTVFKQLLVERLMNYLSDGTASLGTYIDKRDADAMADEMARMLLAPGPLAAYAPELLRFLEAFPRRRLADSEGFLYWSREVYGLKPVISATHVTIYTRTVGGTPMSFVVSRGLYASHYFQGLMALTLAIEAPGAASPALYLVYVNRSRVDALDGAFGGLKRWIAGRRVRGGMDETLSGLRQRLEEDYRTPGA